MLTVLDASAVLAVAVLAVAVLAVAVLAVAVLPFAMWLLLIFGSDWCCVSAGFVFQLVSVWLVLGLVLALALPLSLGFGFRSE